MESIENTKNISPKKLKISPNFFKMLSLTIIGITGFVTGLEPFGGIFLATLDAEYWQIIQIIRIIGYICGASALITIVITVIFKENGWVFTISTFVTAILGSLQFFILAVSSYGEVAIHHFQYVIPVYTSILSIIFVYVYIILKKIREKNQLDILLR